MHLFPLPPECKQYGLLDFLQLILSQTLFWIDINKAGLGWDEKSETILPRAIVFSTKLPFSKKVKIEFYAWLSAWKYSAPDGFYDQINDTPSPSGFEGKTQTDW